MTTGAEPHERDSFAALALGAVGVVFGDIGTSPLYAFREALGQVDPSTIGPEAILGVLSLALWALILIVTTKYVLFLMRADNEGEGGVLVLMSLAQKAVKGRSLVIFALGAAGAALFYGDGIITPALSVLAAVEGLRSVPALHSIVTDQVIIAVTVLILIALFGVQSRGTASVAKLFGPICLVWFLTLGALGFLMFFVVRDAQALLLAEIGIGIAWASILAMPYAILASNLPQAKLGIYMGLFNIFIVVPQLLVATAMGSLMKAFFPGEPVWTMLFAAAAWIVAAIAMLRVRAAV